MTTDTEAPDAIRAGAPPDTLRDAARGIRWSDQ